MSVGCVNKGRLKPAQRQRGKTAKKSSAHGRSRGNKTSTRDTGYVPLNAGERRALQELGRLFEDVEIRIRAGLPCPRR